MEKEYEWWGVYLHDLKHLMQGPFGGSGGTYTAAGERIAAWWCNCLMLFS